MSSVRQTVMRLSNSYEMTTRLRFHSIYDILTWILSFKRRYLIIEIVESTWNSFDVTCTFTRKSGNINSYEMIKNALYKPRRQKANQVITKLKTLVTYPLHRNGPISPYGLQRKKYIITCGEDIRYIDCYSIVILIT